MILALIALAAGQAAPITPAEVASGVAGAPASRAALSWMLIDYPSARFREVYVTVNGSVETGRRGAYLCGFLNSKNRAGGYSGWSAFVALGDIVYLAEGRDADLVADMCGRDDPRDSVDRSELLTAR